MTCWCGADTQQQDYPPFDYYCTAVSAHAPFDAPPGATPAWLVELFRLPIRVYVPSIGTVTGVPNDPDGLASTVWAEIERQKIWFANLDALAREAELGFDATRVIPSRNTDPVTSHKAAAAVTVKAGSQRAHMLQSFFLYDWMDGMTDEEAMERCIYTSPNSEYSKRCSELREAGLIEPTGETRTGASGHQRIVSRITEAGRKVVQSL